MTSSRTEHRLVIPGWRPANLNDLLGHRMKAYRLKKKDLDVVRAHALQQSIPPARGKRRVDLEITLGKGMKKFDRNNCWKSVLDALVEAGLLIDDSEKWLEDGDVDQSRRAAEPSTTIVLTDL